MAEILWTAVEIAAVTKGKVIGADFAVTGISTDTRNLQPGDLFIALKGPHFNGNDFTHAALQAGGGGSISRTWQRSRPYHRQ